MAENSNGLKGPQTLTPDQLPELPTEAQGQFVHSPQSKASFQSVLKHNEDLMARLTVSLRRISHLEKHVEDLKNKLSAENNTTDSLRDELMIQAEKARISESEAQKMIGLNSHKNNTIEHLNTKLRALDDELSGIKEEHSDAKAHLAEEHKADLQKIIDDYEYKVDQLENKLKNLEKYKIENENNFKPQFKRLKILCEKQMDKITQLTRSNTDMGARLNVTQKDAVDDIRQLRDEKSELRAELRQIKGRLLQLLKTDEKYKKTSQQKTYWENKFIDLEAQFKKLKTFADAQTQSTSEQTKKKDEEVRRLKVENYEIKKSWSEFKNETQDLSSKLESAEQQAQSLKYMWQEKDRRIQGLQAQLKIYENMRHDLSSRVKGFEGDVAQKNKKINELLKVIESMKEHSQNDRELIIETAIRGMRDLFFQEDKLPSPEQAQDQTQKENTKQTDSEAVSHKSGQDISF